jgi:hypothetical protein
MAIIVSKNIQLAAKGKTALGAFGTLAGSDVVGPVTDFAPGYTFEQFERQTQSQFAGREASVLGSVLSTVAFNVHFRGSGTAGVANDLEALLMACGHTRRVQTGTASIGAVVRFPSVGHASVPTLTGTFGGTKSGRVIVTITDVQVDSSIDFTAIFYPGDGTAPTAYAGQQLGATGITLIGGPLNSLVLDFGDPSSGTAPFVVGDQFRVSVISAQQVFREFLPSATPSQWGANGPQLADIQAVIDNRQVHKFQNCAGNVVISGNRAENVVFGFNMTGQYVRPIDGTYISAPVYSDVVPPAVKGAFAGWEWPGGVEEDLACFSTFNFDPTGVVNAIDCAGAAQGYDGAFVSDFDPVLTLDVEQKLLSTWNPYQAIESQEMELFVLSIGSAGGNRITLVAESAQLVDCQEGERNGRQINNLTFRFRRRGDLTLNDPNVPYLIRFD